MNRRLAGLRLRTRLPSPRGILTVASVVGVVALAGCGSSSSTATNGVSSKSPHEIVATSIAAASRASRLRITGAVEDNGHHLTIDVRVLPNQALEGTVTEEGHSFELIVIDGKTYVKGNFAIEHFVSPARVNELSGKWVLLPKSKEFGTFKRFVAVDEVFGALPNSSIQWAKETNKTAQGQQAVKLESQEHGTLFVAETGTPYPLEIQRDRGEEKELLTLSFSQFNAPVHIAAPAGAVSV